MKSQKLGSLLMERKSLKFKSYKLNLSQNMTAFKRGTEIVGKRSWTFLRFPNWSRFKQLTISFLKWFRIFSIGLGVDQHWEKGLIIGGINTMSCWSKDRKSCSKLGWISNFMRVINWSCSKIQPRKSNAISNTMQAVA